jgi:histone deacetylase 1/2
LAWVSKKALKQLSELQPAPSVGMHDVPRESVGQHLGFGNDEEEGRDSLDASLARKLHYVSPSRILTPMAQFG